MKYGKMIVSCWVELLVLTTLVSVCASEWEVYNDEDDASDLTTVEEIFLPVNKPTQNSPQSLPVSRNLSKRQDRQKNININNIKNSKAASQLETPTLKGTVLDEESVLAEPEVRKSSAQQSLGNSPKSIHQNEDRGEKVVRGLTFGDEEEGKEEKESIDGDNSLKNVRKFSQEQRKIDTSVHRTDRPEIHRQKKVAKLRKIQNPDLLVAGLPSEHHQQKQIQQQKQQQQQQDQGEGVHQVRELLDHEPEVIGDDLAGPDEKEMQFVGSDCPPGSKSWECLMFADDLLAVRGDQNLSGASSHHRAKRQSDGTTNTNTDNNEDDEDASGDGNAFYPNTVDRAPDLPLSNSLTLASNGGDPIADLAAFREDLLNQLNQQYGSLPGFEGITIDNVEQDPNGEVKVNFTVKVSSDPAEYSTVSNDEYLDKLSGDLGRIGSLVSVNLNVGGRRVIAQTSVDDLKNQASNVLSNPCAYSQCPNGFHNCRVVGNKQVRCDHKCDTFESTSNCLHGSTCELDKDHEPFCSCTKHWSGTYCQLPARDNTLDEGEISGIAGGAVILAAGCIGAVAWFLLCRRKNKNPIFTHYSDEEGSGRFSNPSSKLSNFVIDRPKITIAPINVFNPNNGSQLSRRSSSDTLGSGPTSRPSRPFFSSA